MELEQKTIAIDKKHLILLTQVRAKENHDIITEYYERMQEGDIFPPVEVIQDVDEPEKYWVVDGYHRVYALDLDKCTTIECNVVGKGNEYDALWYSAGANKKNGLRMTSNDIRCAIRKLIDSFPEKTVKEIADHIGCGKTVVYNEKKNYEDMNALTDNDSATDRLKRYLEGNEQAKNYSNRRIARESGVSENTVRRYKNATFSAAENVAPEKDVKLRCDACGKVHSDPSKMLHVDVINHGERIATRHVCDAECASKFKWSGCHFSRVKLQITDEKEVCAHCGKKLDKYVTVGLDNINNQMVGFCNHSCAEAYAKKLNGRYVHVGCDPFLHYECRIESVQDDQTNDVPKEVAFSDGEMEHLKAMSEHFKEHVKEEEPEESPLVEDKTNLWSVLPTKEDYEAQQSPSLLKVTKDSERVKPDIEKPTVRVIKSIELSDPSNLQKVAIDVIKWLGDRAEAFRVIFCDTLDRGKKEIPW